MAKGRITQSKVTSIVDKETGEMSVVEIEKSYVIQTPAEEFAQMYFKFIAVIYELNSLNDVKILIKLCELAKFNTGVVDISTSSRKAICEELAIHSSNFSKSLKRLQEKLLIEGTKGAYKINPAIFWKGEQKVRAQILKEGGLSMLLKFRQE